MANRPVRLGVFMAAIKSGLVGKRGKLDQRAPHHRVRRFKHSAATKREKRVAAEGGFVVLEMVGDRPSVCPGVSMTFAASDPTRA